MAMETCQDKDETVHKGVVVVLLEKKMEQKKEHASSTPTS